MLVKKVSAVFVLALTLTAGDAVASGLVDSSNVSGFSGDYTGEYPQSKLRPGDYDVPGVKVKKVPEVAAAEELLDGFLDEVNKVTVYVQVDGKGSTYRAPVESLRKVLNDSGVKLNKLDEVNSPLDEMVKDKQFVVIRRVVEKPFTKSFVDVKFQSVKSPVEVSCDAGQTTKITTKGVLGTRVEDWVDVVKEGQKISTTKKGEKITVKPVNEVVSPCKKPAPVVTPPAIVPSPSASSSSLSNSGQTVTLTIPGGGTTTLTNDSSNSSTTTSTPTDNSYSDSTDSTDSNSDNSGSGYETIVISGNKYDWLTAAGIPQSDWSFVDYIVNHESSWNYKAVNRSSGATGLCQSLPASKMRSAGADYLDNPVTQLKWCDGYAQERYQGWKNAYSFWVSHKWW